MGKLDFYIYICYYKMPLWQKRKERDMLILTLIITGALAVIFSTLSIFRTLYLYYKLLRTGKWGAYYVPTRMKVEWWRKKLHKIVERDRESCYEISAWLNPGVSDDDIDVGRKKGAKLLLIALIPFVIYLAIFYFYCLGITSIHIAVFSSFGIAIATLLVKYLIKLISWILIGLILFVKWFTE